MAQIKIGLSAADKERMKAEIEESISLNTRKTYSVRFYGNAKDGVRFDDAVGMTANVGLDDNVSVVNDFDNAPIFGDIRAIEVAARDSSDNILVDGDGATIYNRLIQIPNRYFRYREATDGVGSYVEFSVTTAPKEGYVPFKKNYNGSIPAFIYVGAFPTTVLKDQATYLGCQKGQLPYVSDSLNNTNSKMSYIHEEDLGIALTRISGGESLETWDIRAVLMCIEFATRDTQSKFLGICYDNYFNPSDATNLSHNTIGSTNCISVPSTNCIATKSSVGTVISIYNGSHSWLGRTITQMDVDQDNAGSCAGYTKITFGGAALTFTSGWRVALRIGSAVGSTDSIVSSSGNIEASNGYNHFKYRGFEDCYGNNWQVLTDTAIRGTWDEGNGVAINTPIKYVQGTSTFNDLTTWAIIDSNIKLSLANGYASALAVKESKFFTKSVSGGSSNLSYCDYYYQAHRDSAGTSHWQIMGGGVGVDSGYCGCFYFACSSGWGYSNFNLGFRPSVLL